MNGRVAKKIRRELKKKQSQLETNIAYDLKKYVNALSFNKRFNISYRILIARW